MSNDIIKDFQASFKIRSKYCYYDIDQDPEKIAFNGKCRIFVPAFMAYDIKGYTSKILNKPTYKQIFNICCDEYIKKSGNMNDIYFSDLYIPENNMDNVDVDINNLKESLYLISQPFIANPKKVYNIEMRMEGIEDRLDRYLEKNNISFH